MKNRGLSCAAVVRALERLAPPVLAEAWDHTGLLIRPARPRRARRILLTIDLTGAVAREALERRCDFIVTYHPPFLAPLKKISRGDVIRRVLSKLRAARIPVYSPHTALDNVDGGVNDWLADGLGTGRRSPLAPLRGRPNQGSGRLVKLRRPISLHRLARRMETYLGAKLRGRVRGKSTGIRTIAVCAGAGASVLRGAAAEVWLTGEMRHHDLLAARERSVSVLLFGHTQTERGYLIVLRQKLLQALPGRVRILVARSDRDPLS